MPTLGVQTIIAAVLIVLIAGSGFYFYRIQRRPDQFTRNRFAFAGLTVLSTLTLAFIHTFSGPTLLDIASALARWMATGDFTIPEATFEGRSLIVLCIIIVAYTVVKLHREWPGKLTEEQWKAAQLKETPHLFPDALGELNRIVNRLPTPPLHDPLRRREFSEIKIAASSAEFRVFTRDLFCEMLRDVVFEQSGWHDQGEFWRGYHRHTNVGVLLFCTTVNFVAGDKEKVEEYIDKIADLDLMAAEIYQIRRREEDYTFTDIAGQRIASFTIDEVLSAALDLDDYAETIKKRVTVDLLPNSELSLFDAYTPAKISLEAIGRGRSISQNS